MVPCIVGKRILSIVGKGYIFMSRIITSKRVEFVIIEVPVFIPAPPQAEDYTELLLENLVEGDKEEFEDIVIGGSEARVCCHPEDESLPLVPVTSEACYGADGDGIL